MRDQETFDLTTAQRATREQLRTVRELLDMVRRRLREARARAPAEMSPTLEQLERDLVRVADRRVDTAGAVHAQLRNVVAA